jgi:xanthine dehydrogenase YagR molybdenum-binding subunit
MSTEPPRRFVTTTVEIEGRDETKIVEIPDFEPEPWPIDATLHVVGQPLPRVDARDKVTGRARFTTDIRRPDMLHAAIVRAPIARGRLVEIDLSAARATPGVVETLTANDLSKPIRVGSAALFDSNISYAGQPVAAVCAETDLAARRAAHAVVLRVETLPHALHAEQALAPDAPRVRSSGNRMRGSPVVEGRGDVERGLREADVVIRREYRTPSQLHTAMEPHGAVAEWDGDQLTIWESTQGVFRVRDGVADGLGMSRGAVRVILEHMGGGFGGKNAAGTHTFAAALLAKRTGRPVRCVLDREGEQMDTGHRPTSWQRVTLGATREGRLTAIDVESVVELGIGGWDGSPAQIYREMYSCPNVRTVETFVYVNQQAMAAFRAPGHAEGAFGLERTMDVLGRELAIDPLELRLRNFAAHDEAKDRPYSSNQLRRCYEEGATRFGWSDREARRNDPGGGDSIMANRGAAVKMSSGGPPEVVRKIRRGFGMASQVWGTGGGPPAYADVRVNSDGTATVLSGTQDLGTGTRTVLAQIAAESLGARFADVRVVLGDTERTPYASNSWGSMTTPSVGPAVRMAAIEAQRRLFEAAAELLECHPSDLVARDSTISTRDAARHLTFAEVAKRLGNVMIQGRGSRGPNVRGVGLMSFGVQFAEVDVDEETGVVRVLRIVAAHDVGRVINPLLASSQLEGGILQGLGFGMFEERLLDDATGRPLNPTTHEYKIPTMADVPEIDAFCIASSDVLANHTGARGLAEPPLIPTAPAIANAVADALGIEPDELPLAPWRVLAARRTTRMPNDGRD